MEENITINDILMCQDQLTKDIKFLLAMNAMYHNDMVFMTLVNIENSYLLN